MWMKILAMLEHAGLVGGVALLGDFFTTENEAVIEQLVPGESQILVVSVFAAGAAAYGWLREKVGDKADTEASTLTPSSRK